LTLIAAFTIDGIPILIGDLLISAPSITTPEVRVPTVGDIAPLFPTGLGGRAISGLDQKLNIIGDNIAIAWAGSRIQAKYALKKLIERNQQNSLTPDELSAFLSVLNSEIGQEDLSLIGWIVDPKGGPKGFTYGSCEKYTTQSSINVAVAGTGAPDFSYCLDQLRFSNLQIAGGNPNALETAVTYALMLSGTLLQNEIVSLETLRNFYGGGYEIITFVQGIPTKIDDIVYIFWLLEPSSLGWNGVLRKAIKQLYLGDNLVFRGVDFLQENQATEPMLSFEDEMHVIHPMCSGRPLDNIQTAQIPLDPPPLSSRFQCNYFFVIHSTTDIKVIAKVDYSTKGMHSVIFSEAQQGSTVTFDGSFLQEIISIAESTR